MNTDVIINKINNTFMSFILFYFSVLHVTELYKNNS